MTLNGFLKVTGSKSMDFREFMLSTSVDFMIESGILEKMPQKIQEDTEEVHLYR